MSTETAPARTPEQETADRILAAALDEIAEAYGVPARISERWAVAFGGSGELNDGSGFVEPWDDEVDARAHLEHYRPGSRVVRRTVIALPWQAVPAEGEPQP